MTAPSEAPAARTRVATLAACSPRSQDMTPRVEANGFTASTSASSFERMFGITNDVAPKE